MLAGSVGSLLDCPVGTGRFLGLYRKLGLTNVTGIDSSETMLALARKKRLAVVLEKGDATSIGVDDQTYDVVVCVRFLDLIEETAMRAAVTELTRVCGGFIVLTIRLGDKYVPKSNTATHDRKKFRRLMTARGFVLVEEVPVFKAGWVVMKWRRRQ